MEKRCAHKNCENEVDDDDYCYGCKKYICTEHAINVCAGVHFPADHWTEGEVFDDPEVFDDVDGDYDDWP